MGNVCHRSESCDFLQLGHLLKTVVDLELQHDSKLWKRSLKDIEGVLSGIVRYTISDDHVSCSWTTDLSVVMQECFGYIPDSFKDTKFA
jgi:hypothetical protein